MAKSVLGQFDDLPDEGDIIDQVARKTSCEITAVKDKTDFIGLLQSFGIEVKKNGTGWKAKCPFHADSTPSMSVSPEKKVFNCFGCGAKGDVVEFVKQYKHTDFKGALALLADFTGQVTSVPVPLKTTAPVKKTAKAEPVTVSLDAVADHYAKCLTKNRQAMEYLASRGLGDPALLVRFKVGYVDGSLTAMLSEAQKAAFTDTGILRENGTEHFAGCLVFPITGDQDAVVSLYGRKTDDTAAVKHLYIKGGHKSVFGRKASKVYDEIILTESIIDALSLIALGVENVQAVYGTNGFTVEHLQLLKDDRVKTVVIGFDNDDPGAAASDSLGEKLTAEGFAVKSIVPPSGKDWNEFLVSGGTGEAVKRLVSKAEAVTAEIGKTALVVKKEGQRYLCAIGGICYRLLGVKKIFVSSLRVNIRAEFDGLRFLDNVDLYSARSRSAFSQQCARMFETEVQRVENDLFAIVEYLEDARDAALSETGEIFGEAVLTAEEHELGLAFLKAPDMFDQIADDMTELGYVNERQNKLIVYIAAASRFLKKPLNVYIQAGSSGGKSALLSALEQLVLPADIWKATTISSQALNYVDQDRLIGKVFFMGESIHDEAIEGLVRQMQSEGEISRLVTVKDEKTGEMKAELIRKKVRMSFMVTSTALSLNPENASRCLILSADESTEQTGKVHRRLGYNHAFEGQVVTPARTARIMAKHHGAQKLLEDVKVFNPYWQHIGFPTARPSMRRAYEQFLTMIDTICFLRQKQKPDAVYTVPETGQTVTAKSCDLTDYKIAYDLFTGGVLGAGSQDIPTGARQLYDSLRKMAAGLAEKQGVKPCEVSFIQKQIREYTQLGGEFIKKHIRLLASYEYLEVMGGKRHGTRFAYRLREDKPIEEMDISMITTPHQLEAIINEENDLF